MSRKNLNAAIWLIGLGILFLTDLFWPGILILIGISVIVNSLAGEEPPAAPPAPQPPENVVESVAATPKTDAPVAAVPYEPPEAGAEPLPAVLAPEADRLYLASKLPDKCPACDAPLRANADKLLWNGDSSVECMFCGYRLTLKTD
jgi:hypothetical protein